MNLELEKEVNGFVYQVFIDEEDLSDILNSSGGSFDFGDEAANSAYRRHFETCDLLSFIVCKKKWCDCCENATIFVDSLSAIHAAGAEEALKLYLSNYN